jgi:hypothetical protein
VAEARDPYDRQTAGQGMFARTKAKIPGLRETLPVQGAQTNIAGAANEDRSSATKRFFTRAVSQGDKFKDIPPAVAKELQRLDVAINQPSYAQASKITIGKRTLAVPPDAAEKRRAESRRFLIPRVQKLMASSQYQRTDDAHKKQYLERAVEQSLAIGNQKARATVLRLLKQQGAR